MERLHTFAPGEVIVSMIEFKGRILVATSKDIFELKDDKLVKLEFVVIEEIPE